MPISMKTRLEVICDLGRLYEMINELEDCIGGKRRFNEIEQETNRPRSGVYFVFEPNEMRSVDSSEMRITRVGTHAINGEGRTLLDRLGDHWAFPDKSRSHRNSIMRKHIGRSLMNISEGQLRIPSWGRRGAVSETEREEERRLETLVTEHIGDMHLLWVAIDDSSSRSLIERNCIGLLSNHLQPIDKPSLNWLGMHSGRIEIGRSGLWNVHYVNHDYDPDFLRSLRKYVVGIPSRRR